MGILSDYISLRIRNHPELIPELEKVSCKDIAFDHDLSTFTTTDIPQELKEYMLQFIAMNIAISPKAFPSIIEMEKSCLDFIANLYHAPMDELGHHKTFGIATLGSSEACIMAGISMLYNWKKQNKNRILPANTKPNLIVSSAYQICWKKFTDMFDLELRKIPVNTHSCTIKVKLLESAIDENTIGVVGLFANTLTGCYDDIEKINDIVEQVNIKNNRTIPIHVDAASGGFFAPFIQPNILFDFRLKNIISISTSGHKFGFAPPSIGWLIFKNEHYINDALKNELDYLGGGLLKDIGINFSKSAMPLAAQYFLINTLKSDGYQSMIKELRTVTDYISTQLQQIPYVSIIAESNISTIIYSVKNVDMFILEKYLREHYHWQVPAYKLPDSDIICQRIVVRTDLTMDLAKRFILDLKLSLQNLTNASEE